MRPAPVNFVLFPLLIYFLSGMKYYVMLRVLTDFIVVVGVTILSLFSLVT